MNSKHYQSLCQLPKMDSLPTDAKSLRVDFEHYLTHHLGHFLGCRPVYIYQAVALTTRDRLMSSWRNTWREFVQPGTRRAWYMSLEFLMGRALGNHLLNLDLEDSSREALGHCALKLEEIADEEADAGLGNGGLGRLAACFMDSCARLQLPIVGYGLRYEYGMFHQFLEDGFQFEEPDHWLRDGNPWELERPEYTQRVHFGGHTEYFHDQDNQLKVRWVDTEDVLAVPYDMPISGFKNHTINTLRLWKATTTDEFNLSEFNAGSYTESVAAKNEAEHISMVLYPNDSSENGKELRLRQQYFLASASLQDVFQLWEQIEGADYSHFAKQNVFQMNDTHPTIAVAELMRILMDEKGLGWDQSWKITQQSLAYTNHTLLPEALERWSVKLFKKLLPRLLEIIYEINAHFLHEVALHWPGDTQRLRRMSIIEEGPEPQVRMAYLAIVGSFSVNGVAKLHSDLLRKGLFHDFYEMWPQKFNNKTNGVTPRRWIAHANPAMTRLISSKIGEGWISDLSQIHKLAKYADDKHHKFQKNWHHVKQQNKQRMAALVEKRTGIHFDTDALFSVQVKRIHEYKRQLLNLLHVIHLYIRIKKGHTENMVKRCVLIGGKAAPGYYVAKQIIKLINNVAATINDDPDTGGLLKLAFFPNYQVTSMETIAPGADLSEQISTAGKEASGTGNMKFMMNGALTIGTYDGANIEILDAVGSNNFFLFGLKAEEVAELRSHYQPQSYIDADGDLKAVIDLLRSGYFNPVEPGIFDAVLDGLCSPQDPWMTLADFRSYVDTQESVARAWQDQEAWTKMSIRNTASSGFFSTDRTMQDYNKDIWKLKPLHHSDQ
ncbi:MAG: glycogen/starch/alpha-glucan phosphorylase [gamma proteobacterium symbiont of Bathyaustriella thionipta]|nr:glycogen/starch/alpha-glucan phosphorylase [gamma proteobacterium symbiont of Bathyaustriella thionipta]